LKVHHPAEFYCGLINNQPMGFYSVHTLIQDAKRRGMRIRPVSFLESQVKSTVEDDQTVRLGLHRLKGLTAATANRIVQERKRCGFSSLEDFIARVRPSAKEKRLLALSGALNGLPEVQHRRQGLWQVELPFHFDLLSPAVSGQPGELPAMGAAERLSADYSTQGASTGPHPMRLWREANPDRKILRARDLQCLSHGIPVIVAGMAICRQRPGTAKGHCFISLEDETGIANLFVRKETFHRYRTVITAEPFLLAHGRLQRSEGDQPTVYVTDVVPLPRAERGQASASHDFH
jgi:error-prone DNA polymerase